MRVGVCVESVLLITDFMQLQHLSISFTSGDKIISLAGQSKFPYGRSPTTTKNERTAGTRIAIFESFNQRRNNLLLAGADARNGNGLGV